VRRSRPSPRSSTSPPTAPPTTPSASGTVDRKRSPSSPSSRADDEQRFNRAESGELNAHGSRLQDVYDEKYLLLTTFTKDGKPKPTTVWGVPEGDKLLIITDDGSWKTKRINNTPR
jgi:hypothetical protein